MEYKILKGDNWVGICCGCDSELDTFIDVYSNDPETPSPFKSVESAYAFAVMLVNLLEVAHGFK